MFQPALLKEFSGTAEPIDLDEEYLDTSDEESMHHNEESMHSERSEPEPEETLLEVAIKSDPLAQLWWSMQNNQRDYGQWPAVQLSADLSLVGELPANPFDFGREHEALLRCVFRALGLPRQLTSRHRAIADHKVQKIEEVQKQDQTEFKSIACSA